MPLTLDLVRAEHAAQLEEEGRPPFVAVDVLREFIEVEKPARSVNVALDMCVLSIQEFDKYWKLELVDRTAEEGFNEYAAAFDRLDPTRRGRFIFHLALWKNRNTLFNEIDCTAGFTYHFTKVHALTDRFGVPSGSVQLRDGTTMRRVLQRPVAHADGQNIARPTAGEVADVARDASVETQTAIATSIGRINFGAAPADDVRAIAAREVSMRTARALDHYNNGSTFRYDVQFSNLF